MTITTRKPTGKTSWPFILLAGVEGGGKTWAAVETTAMEQVDRAFFIELGEGMADEYGQVPGADFEIIEHDGTVGMVREAIEWASAQPAAEGKFNLLIFDSLSELWSLLSDNAQAEANKRAARKGCRVPDDGAQITMDLWNRATDVWEGIITQLRRFPGPVLGTARLEQVTLMDGNGQPTQSKDWKIQAQKRLPYRVQVIVQARQPRVWTMTKIATTCPKLQLEPGQERTFNDFSVPKLLEVMGIGVGTAPSTFQEAREDDSLSDQPAEQKPAPQKPSRADQVRSFADKLMQAEQAGDQETVKKVLTWAQNKGDGEFVTMTQNTLNRMAQNVVEEVLEGVPVES